MINANQFSKLYAEEYKTTQAEAAEHCGNVWRLLAKVLFDDGFDVGISRLGMFKHKQSPESKVRHPVTGEMIVKPARDVVKFKQSSHATASKD